MSEGIKKDITAKTRRHPPGKIQEDVDKFEVLES